MARYFNPPPNWPRPPHGWTPPEGWQPDPSWGPAPEGWNFWADAPDGAPAPSAPGASAPSAPEAGAGAAASPSPFTPPSGPREPVGFGSPAPGFPPPSGPSDSPFASTSSAPYSGAYTPGGAPTPTPWFKRPLTWILAALAVLLVVVVFALFLNGRGGDDTADDAASPDPTTTATQEASDEPSDEASEDPTDDATVEPGAEGQSENQPFGPNGEGSDLATPLPYGSTSSIANPDTGEVFTYLVGEPVYLADEAVAAIGGNEPPTEGHHFALLPLEVTYHGPNSVSAWSNTSIAYFVADGSEYYEEVASVIAPDDLWEAPEITDGQTASGNMVVEIPAGQEGTGAWVITVAANSDLVFFGPAPAQ